ncbi:hypothetical protein GOP47_0024341 [Adiantum capillus-veneris]|uniref:AAA+ ATPase domain-containing protein n=1 Tax=Adiantum capillus-veneris TaxID=13818 RepID=A0A9D4Z4Y1_ADICA|nr:hypothetical protein GOP47_0024341 [Adiantum capillus-veneris]
MTRFLRNWRVVGSASPYPWTPTSARPRSGYRSYQQQLGFQVCASDQEGRTTSNMLPSAAFLLAFGCGLSFTSTTLLEPAQTESGPMANEAGKENILDKESVMRHAELGIQTRLKSLNLTESAVSPFTISAKGQQVSIKFPVSPLCDLWCLVVDVVSHVGKLQNNVNGGKIIVSASDSVVAQVMTLEHPDYQIERHLAENHGKEVSSNALCIGIFEPMMGEKFPEIEFLKKGSYSEEELDVVVNTLRLSSSETVRKSPRQNYKKQHELRKKSGNKKGALDSLEAMGVKVYGQDNLAGQLAVSWDIIAGYHEQKREIEDTVLLALRCPEVYDSIARGTRRKFESNRPRAILFEGPPGTGKTSSARVIATQSGVPLLYVPLEAVVSKYYGESERMLGKVFNTANELENGAIIFLDEIDSLAMTRDSEMHEATRRMLSVLLRQIDGFEQDSRVVVIAATNRKEDLDPALISRFDSSITFGLPDKKTREEISAQYARHLTPNGLAAIADATEGMSGRDLRDVCQQAERRWASKAIRNNASSPMACGLPPLEEYIESAQKRRTTIQVMPSERGHRARPGAAWPPSVVV